jgi:ferric-dicitrate binding protein FerR (iron transport regulator)
MTHLTREVAARWVAGVLEPAEADAVEAHAATCRECEALLQAEARAEASLAAAVRAAPPAAVVPLRPRRRPYVVGAAALAALAAAVAFIVWSRVPPTRLEVATRDAGVGGGAPLSAFRPLDVPEAVLRFEGELPPADAFTSL